MRIGAGLVLAMCAGALAVPSIAALVDKKTPYFGSISAGKARMRTGPGRSYPSSWLYQRADLPVKVLDIYDHGAWYKIEDPGGIQGWMMGTLVSETRTGLVMGTVAELRSEPRDGGAHPVARGPRRGRADQQMRARVVFLRRARARRLCRGGAFVGRGAGRSAELMSGMRIVRDDLKHPEVEALVALHLRAAFENSPPGAVFALDLSGLRDPSVTLWTAWEGDTLLGMGALKALDANHGELKSMRTAPGQLRRGVARTMLAHLIDEARVRGYRRLSLETGSNAPFAAARALYAGAEFVECGPFGGYVDGEFSRYFTLEL